MKAILQTLLIGVFLVGAAGSGFTVDAVDSKASACEKLRANGSSLDKIARSGCCSHHGGVCGCSGGRALCCDGALSPSCGCHAPETPNKDAAEAYNRAG